MTGGEGVFLSTILPALIGFGGSALQAAAAGGGADIEGFPESMVLGAIQEAQNAIRQQLGVSRQLQEAPIEIPGTDISGIVGPAQIAGLPTGTIGIFPGVEDVVGPRSFPGLPGGVTIPGATAGGAGAGGAQVVKGQGYTQGGGGTRRAVPRGGQGSQGGGGAGGTGGGAGGGSVGPGGYTAGGGGQGGTAQPKSTAAATNEQRARDVIAVSLNDPVIQQDDTEEALNQIAVAIDALLKRGGQGRIV